MPTAYLTIDDAPSDELPSKLDVLRERDVPAVFFCEGRRLADHAEHARRAVEAGFHLGNHAYSHTHASELSPEAFREEVERTEALVEDVYDRAGVDRPAKLFRFPYGDRGGERDGGDAAHADALQEILADVGFEPPAPGRIEYDWYRERHGGDRDWFWTVDLEDWELDSRAELAERVAASAERLRSDSPDVVLFHDAWTAVERLADLVEVLRERDVTFGEPLALVD